MATFYLFLCLISCVISLKLTYGDISPNSQSFSSEASGIQSYEDPLDYEDLMNSPSSELRLAARERRVKDVYIKMEDKRHLWTRIVLPRGASFDDPNANVTVSRLLFCFLLNQQFFLFPPGLLTFPVGTYCIFFCVTSTGCD